ncbi:MAG: membrane protein insertase YidC [Actinomycetota bacterium]
MGRVLAYFYSVIPSYGIAIILLTVVVRVLMIPLAIKQAHSMQANRGNQEKMRQLAPEVKKIKEKYKNDRARQYEEQKKLYDKHGVNMLGGLSGCVPMLLQAPIFMAMYGVLQGCDKLIGSRTCELGNNIPTGSGLHAAIVGGRDTFLAMNLNSTPVQVWNEQVFVGVLPYAALVTVMGVSMWLQTKQMMRMQPAPADPQMAQTQKLMQFMPLMVVVFSVNFPAGLTVYWTASNVWTIGQQYILLKKFGSGTSTGEKNDARSDGKALGANRAAGRGRDESKNAAKQPSNRANKGQAAKTGPDKRAAAPKGRPTPKRPPKGAGGAPTGRPRRGAASGARVGAKGKGATGGGSAARKANKGRG